MGGGEDKKKSEKGEKSRASEKIHLDRKKQIVKLAKKINETIRYRITILTSARPTVNAFICSTERKVILVPREFPEHSTFLLNDDIIESEVGHRVRSIAENDPWGQNRIDNFDVSECDVSEI